MRNNKGFTLVELIVVIAIMGVILILALPQVSKIQSANKNKKYDAYYSSIESGAKLYIDSRSKDLFGNNTSGCVTVPYSELKKQNLIKDFGDKNITCSNDAETYVEVRKVNDNYLYSTAITCRNSEKIVYEKKIDTDLCTNEPDTKGPTVTISPSSRDWVQSKNLKISIIISDDYTLNKNIGIIYYWTDISGTKVSEEYTHNYKNKKGVKKVTDKIPTSNIPTVTGQYKLVVRPWYSSSTNGIQDALGNQTVIDTVAGIYKIDNDKPVCGDSSGDKTTWSNTPFKIEQACDDAASGCKETSYSKYFGSSIKTYTFTIEDNAGNTNTCEVDVYLDVDKPSCGSKSGENKTWTNQNQEVTVACNDTGGSECVKDTYSETISSEGKTGVVVIEDNAGNSRNCTVNTYIDKTPPTCVSSGGNAAWTNGARTLTGDCSDNLSGCTTDVIKKYTKDINSTTEGPGKVYDNAGNSTDCPANQTVKIDKTAPSAPAVELVNGSWQSLPDNTWSSTLFYTAGSTDKNNPVPKSTDSGSGISKYQISPNNKVWYDWNFWDQTTFSNKLYRNYSDGITYRYVRAVDKAGNVSGVTKKTIKQDLTAPRVHEVLLKDRVYVEQKNKDDVVIKNGPYIKDIFCKAPASCTATVCLVDTPGSFDVMGVSFKASDVGSGYKTYWKSGFEMYDYANRLTPDGGCLSQREPHKDNPCQYWREYTLEDYVGNTSTFSVRFTVDYIGGNGESGC